MDNRGRLLQTFEDEYFKIMIHEMIEEDGERLLEENRRLNDDRSLVIPDTLRQKCLSEINRSINVERKAAWGKKYGRGLYELLLHYLSACLF